MNDKKKTPAMKSERVVAIFDDRHMEHYSRQNDRPTFREMRGSPEQGIIVAETTERLDRNFSIEWHDQEELEQ